MVDIKEVYITTDDGELIFSIGEDEKGIIKSGYKVIAINKDGVNVWKQGRE